MLFVLSVCVLKRESQFYVGYNFPLFSFLCVSGEGVICLRRLTLMFVVCFEWLEFQVSESEEEEE